MKRVMPRSATRARMPKPRKPLHDVISNPPQANIDPDNLVGQTVDGKYQCLSVIGEGGMGKIYKAKTPRGRTVALKVIKGAMSDRALVERFIREVKAMKETNHPNTVQVYDLGQVGPNVYCVMQYLRGNDLALEIRKDAQKVVDPVSRQEKYVRTPLPWPRVKEIMVQVCEGVYSAHKRGILHRDLKPGNIFLHESGGTTTVKVVDFGLAKFTEKDGDLTVTKSGTVMGTFKYMAPELTLGMKEADERSDQYSIGIIMYELLTGRVPFEADEAIKVLRLHVDQIPTPPTEINPSIPKHVEAIILRALEKKKSNRFPSLKEMKAAIESDGQVSGVETHIVRSDMDNSNRVNPNVELHGFRLEPEEEIEQKSPGMKVAATLAIIAVVGTLLAFQKQVSEFIDRAVGSGVPAAIQEKTEAPSKAPKADTTFEATIESVPPGAVVYNEDKKEVGKTTDPLVLELERGEHTFTLKMGGHLPKRVVVSPQTPKAKIYLPKRRGRARSLDTADPVQSE